MRKVLKFLYSAFANIVRFTNKIYLRLFRVQFGSGLKINGNIFIRNRGKIIIGNNVRINSNLSSNPVGGPYKTSLVAGDNAILQIGDNVGVSGLAIVAQNSVIVENDVRIGSGTCIYDTDFHSINFYERMSNPDTNVKVKPVKICKGAFIGARSIVLKGVTIGEKAVVGAGSVVTKNIPPNEIWAGNPAVFVKKIDQ